MVFMFVHAPHLYCKMRTHENVTLAISGVLRGDISNCTLMSSEPDGHRRIILQTKFFKSERNEFIKQ